LINVYPENLRRATEITAQVKTLNGENVGEPFSASVSRGQNMVTLTSGLENIKTWSPEFPELYTVELRLKNRNSDIHVTSERFGFRTVEVIEGNGIFVNGEKIKFRGVNRHSFWPESGRALSKELNIADINLMKDMNMNAVRMSHYPPDKNFIEACDSLGFL
jgi:beta-galactosidase/beta-glucuronidase